MQALRALVSPERKKPRTEEAVSLADSDEEEMYAASAHDEILEVNSDYDSDDEEQPAWARKQEKRMLKRLTEIMITNMQEVKNDVAQLKLQVNLAVAISEDAMKNTEDLSCKIKEIEKQYVTPEMLTAKIEEAIRKIREEFAKIPRVQSASAYPPNQPHKDGGEDVEKLTRTVVIGGFAQDSDRDDVTSLIEKHVISETDEAVEEIYAYTFGSFIRFVSIDGMRTFLRKFGARPRPNVGGTTLWATQSKNPGERRKSKHLGKHKRVLIEVGLAKSDGIKIDYRRGILMVKRVRVAEWKGDGEDGSLELHEENLKKVGIDVGKTVLQNAVHELLSQ